MWFAEAKTNQIIWLAKLSLRVSYVDQQNVWRVGHNQQHPKDALIVTTAFCCSFEKMISGMYMGELVRLVMVKCARDGLLFNGEVSQDLEIQGRFYTKYVSEVEK